MKERIYGNGNGVGTMGRRKPVLESSRARHGDTLERRGERAGERVEVLDETGPEDAEREDVNKSRERIISASS